MGSSEIKFSEDHTWVLEIDGKAKLGITDYAQEQLGEIVEISLTESDTYIDGGDTFGEIESQKAVTELTSPISGTLISVNERVLDDPSIINVDPYGRGWLIELDMSDIDELKNLMEEEDYEAFIEE